ncbi:TonB-dependent receptor [Marinoscillum sp.]|uniref:TonB-dependent receptor n=1 Tax=Marinoscillum sp. TaxID=2024838 RepID=UPI003BADB05D
MKRQINFLLASFTVSIAFAQTQVVRGTVLDTDSKSPLIGATIQVLNHEPLIGSSADLQGNFRLDKVPYGRVDLLVQSVGYSEKVIPNILVTAAKEVILTVEMTESIEKLEEVVVTAQKDKAEVLNEMALVSARSFSVEETQRYAGAFNDPARLVASFAGVNSNAEGNNDIVVRGNSPKGILWRLEGVEIPNPNHFANEGSTGGPINALNSNMLANSDFLTGAFAPEYGNALSGVFDMKYKKGNNQTREYTASASTLGIDFTAEGPFQKGYNGSYIANYRYSSLQLLDEVGIVDFGGVPKYQDAALNVNLPLNKDNHLSIFGLGGISSINAEEFHDNGDRAYRGKLGSKLGVFGVSHVRFFNEKAFLKTTLAYTGTELESIDELVNEQMEYYETEHANINKNTLRLLSTFNYKFNAQHKIESGVILSRLGYVANARSYNFDINEMEDVLKDEGATETVQAFTSWKYRLNDDWTFTTGIHSLYFNLNQAISVEPRAAMRWKINSRNSVNAGFGIHSKLNTISTYLARVPQPNGSILQPNKNLKPSKAAHFVVGYDYLVNPQTHLKAEVYYQHLYQVPIDNTPGSSYSILNESDTYGTIPLTNDGTGRNYGLELTYERFFHNGLYYMSTISLYESFYTGADGIERSTAFNGNYIVNFIGGKEFAIGKTEKNRVMFVNTKLALLGGGRYTSIDLQASREAGYTIYDESDPLGQQGEDVFFLNLSIGIRRNKGNTTRELKLDANNITGNQALVREYYLQPTEDIEKSYQLPMIPNLVYTFKF